MCDFRPARKIIPADPNELFTFRNKILKINS